MATPEETAAAVTGLRDLADLLERSTPRAITGLDLISTANLLFCRIDREEFIASVKALGPFDTVDAEPDGKYLTCRRRFGPFVLQLYIERAKLGEATTELRPVSTFTLAPEVSDVLRNALAEEVS